MDKAQAVQAALVVNVALPSIIAGQILSMRHVPSSLEAKTNFADTAGLL